MRNGNETPSKTISPDVAIPIEMFDVLRAARWRRVKIKWIPLGVKRRMRSWSIVSTHFGVAWDPVEMSYWLRRMLGEDER